MATKRVVVEGSSVTASQLKDLFRQIEDGSLSGCHIQEFLEHRNPFKLQMGQDARLPSRCALIKGYFGIKITPNQIPIPAHQSGFDRLIVVPGGLTLNQIIKVCRQKLGNVHCVYDDFDRWVVHNERTNGKTYAIWVRDRVEADEELKGLSVNQLQEKHISGITLMERLLFELDYFAETGKHLDLESFTLCSGSRDSDGSAPRVLVLWLPRAVHLPVRPPGQPVCQSPCSCSGFLTLVTLVFNP